MKITKEDIEKYATGEEKAALNEAGIISPTDPTQEPYEKDYPEDLDYEKELTYEADGIEVNFYIEQANKKIFINRIEYSDDVIDYAEFESFQDLVDTLAQTGDDYFTVIINNLNKFIFDKTGTDMLSGVELP